MILTDDETRALVFWLEDRLRLCRVELRFSMAGPCTCCTIGRMQMPTSFCNLSFSVFTTTQVFVMRWVHEELQVAAFVFLSEHTKSSRNKKTLQLCQFLLYNQSRSLLNVSDSWFNKIIWLTCIMRSLWMSWTDLRVRCRNRRLGENTWFLILPWKWWRQTVTWSTKTAATFATSFDTDTDCSTSNAFCALLDLVSEVIVMIVVPPKNGFVLWKNDA